MVVSYQWSAVYNTEPWPTVCTSFLCPYGGCSTGADPATDPTTLGSVAKVVGSWGKWRKNAELVMKFPTGWYRYRQDLMSILTRRRVGDFFCTMTNRITNRQAVKTNRQAGSMFRPFPRGLIVFVGRYLKLGPRIGIHITLYKPLSPKMCHSYHTS